jgi:hypothetical protein
MNFAARDCGLVAGRSPAGLKVFAARSADGLNAFFGFSKVRSSRDCFGLPFGAPSMFFDLEAVRSWKRCARSFERSARRTSFFVPVSRSE